MADLDYHLTTLFPPVRPRGYLELRCLDALPDRWWPALAAITVTLVDDPVAADAAAELCAPVADSWETAARHGLDDETIRRAVTGCAELAAAALSAVAEGRRRELRRADRVREQPQRRAAPSRSRRADRSPCSRRKRVPEPSLETAARGLEASRARTLRLTDFDETELTTQHSPLMSPLVWDLAHIGQQEDLWLLRGGNAAAQGLLSCKVEQLYDAFEHPRASRVSLPLLGPDEARSFIADVRGRVFDGLERVGDETPERLFPYVMVEQHEQQHVETMLATHQLRHGAPLLGGGSSLPPGRPVPRDSVLVPAGPFTLGVDGDDEPWSLDNERPAHTVDLPAFRIARVPVTNAEWQAFIEAGGYDEPRWWSERGWRHRVEAGLERPLFWSAGRFAHALRQRRGDPGRRARAARLLLRGRGLCHLGGRQAAHRAGVGEGVRLGPGAAAPATVAVGRLGVDARHWPTSAATPCAPRPWAPTRRAPPPMASSS